MPPRQNQGRPTGAMPPTQRPPESFTDGRPLDATHHDMENKTLTGTRASRDSFQSGTNVQRRATNSVEIDGGDLIKAVTFLVDGKHLVSGGDDGKIRFWRVEDGRELGTPMDTKGPVRNIAVSRDGRWVVTGTKTGQVMAKNMGRENYGKVTTFKAHNGSWVYVVDISPDGTRIATGSSDKTCCVWFHSSGKRLVGPLQHDNELAAVKFSPDGSLVATATWERASVRVYDSREGRLLVDCAIEVNSPFNQSLAWASDSRKLFALARTANINCIDFSSPSGPTLSQWAIHRSLNGNQPSCIALEFNGTLIAASNYSSVSFWDTVTHQQVGSVIEYTHNIMSMAISANFDMVTAGGRKISLRNFRNVLAAPPADVPRQDPQRRSVSSSGDSQHTHDDLQNEKIADLEGTIQTLLDQLSSSEHKAEEKQNKLEETIKSLQAELRARDENSNSTNAELGRTIQEQRSQLIQYQKGVQQLQDQLAESKRNVDHLGEQLTESQQKADRFSVMLAESRQNADQLGTQLTESRQYADRLGALLTESRQNADKLDGKLSELTQNDQKLRAHISVAERNDRRVREQLAKSQEYQKQATEETYRLKQILHAHEHKHQCEVLYAQGRVIDAVHALPEIANTQSSAVRSNQLIMDWVTEFTNRCTSKLELIGNEASASKRYDEALAAYSAALSLGPSTQSAMQLNLASTVLARAHGSPNEIMRVAMKHKLPKFIVYRAICDALERDDRVMDAVACFRLMGRELTEDIGTENGRAQWELDFQTRCGGKLRELGDTAMVTGNYSKAMEYYSNALSLHPENLAIILVKCCKARAGLLQKALVDVDEFVRDNPSSHIGYQRRHAVLHSMCRHKEACEAFDAMVSKLKKSRDPKIQELHRHYVDATPDILQAVQNTIRDMPRVLIDTDTGLLCDKTQRASAFEQSPTYHELRSSMTARLDIARILEETRNYYRYVMFSHRWENGEPLLQAVQGISVYKLEPSPANVKLQTFCRLARRLGFRWVWSDTCCIDKRDNVVLHESLVAMFRWYHGSSLTIVYLRGVWSQHRIPDALRYSIWNTRAWTYQEYVASGAVQFYTEDWKPYLGLELFNHKESSTIVTEMQQSVGEFKQELAALQPGLNKIREKLYLASMRETTLVEDIAYSLLGIFNITIPVVYGEGNRAVGRLLEHLVMGSGDVTILAWTGRSGGYNSCLPTDLTVYSRIMPLHVPQPMEATEMEKIVMTLRSSLPDLSPALTLQTQVDALSQSTFAATLLRLPGIIFPISELVAIARSGSNPGSHVYRAVTRMLGDVEIETADVLSKTDNFVFIHPWISCVLDQEYQLHGKTGMDDTTRALRLVARLRQPFGALLLAPQSRVAYRRVATDCFITVQVREDTPLTELIDGIKVVGIQ